MNFRRGKNRDEPEINMIPFIDILLVTLIFLMVATTYNKFSELQISLPNAQKETVTKHPKEITVMLNAAGEYAINKERVLYKNTEQLAAHLKDHADMIKGEATVIIAADGNAPHQNVVNILEAARLAGLHRLTFATQKRPE